MTNEELLKEVKSRIGITGTFQDNTIKGHIQDVKDFMVDAGVPESIMSTNKIIGAVTRGVSDLWNYGSGNGEFSSYFYQRVIQLSYSSDDNDDLTENEELINYTSARIGEIILLADKWEGKENLYSQIVSVEGATENSQIDMTPSVEQLVIFYEKDISFVTENEAGVVTVYAIGQKPTNDYTIQVTITEVEL